MLLDTGLLDTGDQAAIDADHCTADVVSVRTRSLRSGSGFGQSEPLTTPFKQR